MQVSPELMSAVVAVVVAILSTLAGWLNKRERSRATELKQLQEEFADLREQILLSDAWLFLMTRALAQNGLQVPEPPEGLRTNFGVSRRGKSSPDSK